MCFSFLRQVCFLFFFFFNDTATTEIYTLSLHDALPISGPANWELGSYPEGAGNLPVSGVSWFEDRKSTRLNSSHDQISYAVFCLKKKKRKHRTTLAARIKPCCRSAPECIYNTVATHERI